MWCNAHNAAYLFVIAKLPIPPCAVVKNLKINNYLKQCVKQYDTTATGFMVTRNE